ncbi:MAG: hypothetical protein M3Y59_06830 [Myxococcota bacterium]|nr:hypothetical protein [Myxococcota bacterium]
MLVLTPGGGGRYDLCTDRWRQVEPLLTGRTDYGLPQPSITERNLFFVGPTTLSQPFGIFARFDLRQHRWRALAVKGAPRPRLQHLQTAVGDKLVLYLGQGGTGHSEPRFADGAVFVPATGVWTPMPQHEHSIGFETAVALGDQLLIFPYGYRYDLKTGGWGQLPTTGMPRPYQPILHSTGKGLVTLGGMWTE